MSYEDHRIDNLPATVPPAYYIVAVPGSRASLHTDWKEAWDRMKGLVNNYPNETVYILQTDVVGDFKVEVTNKFVENWRHRER